MEKVIKHPFRVGQLGYPRWTGKHYCVYNEEFLKSYSCITEEEYDATAHEVWERAYRLISGNYGAL